MAASKNKNNAYSTLAAPLTTTATTLTVGAGHGDRFPQVTAPDWAIITLQNAANAIEIIKVTARAGGADSMTIVRAQEGTGTVPNTTGLAWNTGDIVECRLTSGTAATQDGQETLSNKTLASPVLTTPTLSGAISGPVQIGTGITFPANSTAAQARAAISAPPRATRVSVASAATIDLTANAPDSDDVLLTGTNAVSVVTVATDRVVRFTAGGACSLVNGAGLVTQTGGNIQCQAGDTWMFRATAANTVEVMNYVKAASLAAQPLGQCKLSKSGSNLLLAPYKGNQLTINGVNYTIPSAGVTLAPTSLSVGSNYFIYAYMSGATMTLEASATGHATDTATGQEIKSGDATRTLVGYGRITTGPAWTDTNKQKFVRSWFNDNGITDAVALPADVGFGWSPFAELNSAIRLEFLTWSGEQVSADAFGTATDTTSTCNFYLALGLDSTSVSPTPSYAGIATSTVVSAAVTLAAAYNTTPSEGYHYQTLLVGQASGSSPKFYGTYTGHKFKTVRA